VESLGHPQVAGHTGHSRSVQRGVLQDRPFLSSAFSASPRMSSGSGQPSASKIAVFSVKIFIKICVYKNRRTKDYEKMEVKANGGGKGLFPIKDAHEFLLGEVEHPRGFKVSALVSQHFNQLRLLLDNGLVLGHQFLLSRRFVARLVVLRLRHNTVVFVLASHFCHFAFIFLNL